MYLFNNWLFQSLFSNVIWIVIVAVFKWIYHHLKEENIKIEKDQKHSKKLTQKQFNISFWVSSISTISIFIILGNHLQYAYSFLFLSLIVVDFFCFMFMLGAFEESLKYMPDDKFDKKH